jgi:hypothetical protein
VRKVSVEDVQKILRDVVAGVFVPEKADLVVTCGGIMKHVSCLNVECEDWKLMV